MAVYPSAVKTFSAQREQATFYAAHINVLSAEVRAIQAVVGRDPHVEPPRAGGEAAIFADLGERIANRAPSVVVSAETTFAPNAQGTGSDVVWDSVSTRRDGSSTTVLGSATVAIPVGRTYLVHLSGVGLTTAPTDARVRLFADRTIGNYRLGTGAAVIEGPENFTVEQVVLPPGQRPAGSRWMVKTLYSDGALWVRPSQVDTATATAVTRVEATLLADEAVTAEAGQPYPLTVADVPLAPARAMSLRVVLTGAAPPGLRLVVLSADSPTVMP